MFLWIFVIDCDKKNAGYPTTRYVKQMGGLADRENNVSFRLEIPGRVT